MAYPTAETPSLIFLSKPRTSSTTKPKTISTFSVSLCIMETIETITRRWGNSIAIIIPADIVQKQNIRENKPVKISIENVRPKAGVLFGKFPKWRLTTQEMKDEARRGWLSASDREREREWKKRMGK